MCTRGTFILDFLFVFFPYGEDRLHSPYQPKILDATHFAHTMYVCKVLYLGVGWGVGGMG